MADKPIDKRRAAFWKWDELTEVQRLDLGLPVTDLEYSKTINVADPRTLRRWRQHKREAAGMTRPVIAAKIDSDFDERLANLPSGASQTENIMELAFEHLGRLAATGNVDAIKALLNTPIAKAYYEAHHADYSSSLANVSDAELVLKLRKSLSDEDILAEVEERGL